MANYDMRYILTAIFALTFFSAPAAASEKTYINPETKFVLQISGGRCRMVTLGIPNAWFKCAWEKGRLVMHKAGAGGGDVLFRKSGKNLTNDDLMISGTYYPKGSKALAAALAKKDCVSGDCYNGTGVHESNGIRIEGEWKKGKPVGPMKVDTKDHGVKITMITKSGMTGPLTVNFEFPGGGRLAGEFEGLKSATGPATITMPDGSEYRGVWRKGLFDETTGVQICDYDKEIETLTCEAPVKAEDAAATQDSEVIRESDSEAAP